MLREAFFRGRPFALCADKQLPMTRDKTQGRDPAVEDDTPTEDLAALTEAEIAAMEAQEQPEAKADGQQIATGQFEVSRDDFDETWPTSRNELGARDEIGALQSEIAQLRSDVMALRKETETLTKLRDKVTDESKGATKDNAELAALQQPEFDTGETRKLVGHGERASCEFAIRPGRMRLGSAADNDISIEGRFVSGHHAQILSSSDETILRDMDSTNGTYVNSRRINKCALHDGDSIKLGNLSFTFVRKRMAAADVPAVARMPEPEHSARLDRGSWR
jgi:hypothetical protein